METSDYYKNSGVFRLTPGVYYTNNEELSIKGGINVDIAYGPGPKFGVSPVMNLIYKIDDNTSF